MYFWSRPQLSVFLIFWFVLLVWSSIWQNFGLFHLCSVRDVFSLVSTHCFTIYVDKYLLQCLLDCLFAREGNEGNAELLNLLDAYVFNRAADIKVFLHSLFRYQERTVNDLNTRQLRLLYHILSVCDFFSKVIVNAFFLVVALFSIYVTLPFVPRLCHADWEGFSLDLGLIEPILRNSYSLIAF